MGTAAASVTGTARAPRRGLAVGPSSSSGADGCSAKLFHSPQPGHWPSHFPDSWPQEVQKNTISATGSLS